MQVKLKVQVRLPFSNEYIDKGTILEVVDEKGAYYICQNENVGCVFILKGNLEVIRK